MIYTKILLIISILGMITDFLLLNLHPNSAHNIFSPHRQ